ncbi:MAG: hypothetical protein OEZ13_05300 [Spirochaetia bacterium]|nr:hypothetical protein [Spirochaetia bacterium]
MIQTNTKKQIKNIYIDTSYSSFFTDLGEKKKIIDQVQKEFSIKNENIYDFSGKPIEKEIFDQERLYNEKISPKHETFSTENAVIISDISNSQTQKKENSIIMPFTKKVEGIFDSKIPTICYSGQVCSLNFLIHINDTKTFKLEVLPGISYEKKYDKKQNGWIKWDIKIPEKTVSQNIQITLKIKNPRIKENLLCEYKAILSIHEGLPKGLFLSENMGILSWRIAYALQKNSFWNIKTVNSKREIFNAKYDYLFLINENIKENKKPAFIVVLDDRKINEDYGIEIYKDFYKNKNIYRYFWHIPPKAEDIFLSLENIEKALHEFARNLRADMPILSGGSADYNKPVYLERKLEAHEKLYYKNILISPEYDPLTKKDFFILSFWGNYIINDFKFASNIQREEKISIYNALEKKFQILPIKKVISKIKDNLNSNNNLYQKYLDIKSLTIGFQQPENPVYYTATMILYSILFFYLLALWYFPSYKD